MAKTLYDKIFEDHIVDTPGRRHLPALYRPASRARSDQPAGLRGAEPGRAKGARDRSGRWPSSTTTCRRPTGRKGIDDDESRLQVETLAKNTPMFGVEYYDELDKRQGIVHVIGPEQGFTLPGTTIVCGDSHTSTHGAFGALAHGIGTSEVEHVLATQTLIPTKAKNMRVTVDGKLPARRDRQRTSSLPSSARSAPPAAPGTSSNTTAKRSARCPWKAG